MIPLLAVVRVDGSVRYRLSLPLFLLWILLLPFALLLLPFALILLIARRTAVWPVLSAVVGPSSAMRGTYVEVSAPRNSVFVHVW